MFNNGLSHLDQLALLTKVRQELSVNQTKFNIGDIIENTQILDILSQVFKTPDNSSELMRYLKLEGSWILTNLAYGTEKDTSTILSQKYGFLDFANSVLQSKDLQMID